MATDNIATLGIKVDPKGAIAGANRAKRAIRSIGDSASKVKSRIFSLNGAMGALGIGMVAKSALNYASSIEKLQIQLKFLTGDTKKAGEAFKVLTDFAKKAPFSLKEIQKASAPLSIVADTTEELNELLSMTGDIASVTGMSFETVSQNILRAMEGGIGASEMFKEKGVKNMLGFVDGVQYTADQTKAVFFDAFRDGTTTIKGATKDMANTFDGQVSMMGDAWDALQLAFMKEGIFDSTKSSVQELTGWLKDPATLRGAKSLANSVLGIGSAIKSAIDAYTSMPPWVQKTGIVLAFLGGVKGRLVVAVITAISAGVEAVKRAILGVRRVGKIDVVGNARTELQKFTNELARVQNKIDKFDMAKVSKGIGKKLAKKSLSSLENRATELKGEIATMQSIISGGGFAKLGVGGGDSDSVIGGLSEKRLKKLRGGVISYKDSLKDVGVEVTKGMEFAREYQMEVTKIKSALDLGKISGDDYKTMLVDMTTAYGDAINRMDEADIANKVQELTDSMAGSITDMIMNLGQGTQSFKDSVKDMARVVLAEFVKIKLAQPMANFLAGGIGGYDFSSLFREHGGTVTGNKPYVVGESGAELFLPNKTGTIIPNDAVSMGGSTGGETNVSVSFNITANDTTGFDDLLVSRRGMIVGIINQAMNDRGITGVTA